MENKIVGQGPTCAVKKLLSFMLAIAMLFSLAAGIDLSAYAADIITSGDYRYLDLEDGTIRIYKYTGSDSDITIPSEIDGKTVTVISQYAFPGHSDLTNVIIPNTVTTIELAAFSGCKNLLSVTIPNSVINIGAYAFENSLILQDSVVYFNGTIEEWHALYTACNTYGNNDSLFNCTVYCSDGVADCKHEFDDGVVTKAASCTEYGIKAYTCTACGVIKNESIPANGHTTVTIEGVAPTCTEPGKTSGLYCTVCDKVLIAQATLPAAHSYDDGVVTKAATCKETGIKTYTCTNCGETKTEATLAKGHTAAADEAIEPTCTKTGLTKGYHCSVCNTVIIEQKVVSATGHSYDNGKVTKAATCTGSGTKTYTCTKCKATKSETIIATGHKAVTDKAVAATCTSTGKTAGSHCSVCNKVIIAQITVPVTSHSYDNGKETTPASCTTDGIKTYTCTKCHATKTETLHATGHNYKTTTNKANAKTKKNGSKVTKCSLCGAKKSTTTIYYPKTITLSKTSYVYNGKAQKPTVTVKDSKGKKIAESNYTVKYTNNKNVGKATVTITFKGNYSGTVNKTFTINPKATTLLSVTAKSKGFTVKWKKLTTQTTGYQIQYSTDKNFKKNNKTVIVSKNSTTSKSVSKLTAKKKYYVRIRTYKTVKVNGKNTKIYSSWSKFKSVTTKK